MRFPREFKVLLVVVSVMVLLLMFGRETKKQTNHELVEIENIRF